MNRTVQYISQIKPCGHMQHPPAAVDCRGRITTARHQAGETVSDNGLRHIYVSAQVVPQFADELCMTESSAALSCRSLRAYKEACIFSSIHNVTVLHT